MTSATTNQNHRRAGPLNSPARTTVISAGYAAAEKGYSRRNYSSMRSETFADVVAANSCTCRVASAPEVRMPS